MDKQYFVDKLNIIWVLIQHERDINDALYELDPDFGGFSMSKAITLCVDMLKKMYNDGIDGWIDYFLWETDFGQNDLADSVTEADGTKIPFRTPSDVYDLIMSEQESDYKKGLITIDEGVITMLDRDRCHWKALYENEKSHTDTLERLIEKIGGNNE